MVDFFEALVLLILYLYVGGIIIAIPVIIIFYIYAEKPGTASEKDFEEWSVRSSNAQAFAQSNPVKFQTLNLTKIIKILNAVSNDTFEKTLIASFAIDFNLVK